MYIQIFGATEVTTDQSRLYCGELGGVKHRRILQLLVLRRSLGKAELAELLWEGAPPPEYVATLESYVSGLRRRLDPQRPARTSVVLTRTGGYELDADRVDTDVWRFDRLATVAPGMPVPAALGALQQALALAERPLLADEAYPSWAETARDRYQSRLVQVATRAAGYALELGRTDLAHEYAGRAIGLDPLAESAWRTRMSACALVGDRAGALRYFQSCRQALRDELGVEPSPATAALFLQVLRAQEPVPPVDTVSAAGVSHLVAAVLAAARELAGGAGTDPVAQLLARTERLVRAQRPAETRRLVPRPRHGGVRATA